MRHVLLNWCNKNNMAYRIIVLILISMMVGHLTSATYVKPQLERLRSKIDRLDDRFGDSILELLKSIETTLSEVNELNGQV